MGDEPTGNLDSKSADRVFSLFEDLINQGKTFMMVTHDLHLASRIPRVVEVLDGKLFDNGNGYHALEENEANRSAAES